MFLIMINDINSNINSDLSLFDDDTKIIRPGSNIQDVEDLLDDQWQETNNMAFKSKKFEILRNGWDEELKNSTEYLTPPKNLPQENPRSFSSKLLEQTSTPYNQPHIGDLIPNVCNQFTAKPSNSLIDVIPPMTVNFYCEKTSSK
jgi:hypothetical protein